MKRLVQMVCAVFIIWMLALLGTAPALAQNVYTVEFANPCTGEMVSLSASVEDRNGTYYAIYTVFGQTREFNTDDPNWYNEASDWLISVYMEELDCGYAVSPTSFDPTTNTVMNSTVRTLQNDLFTMDITPPGARRSQAGNNEDKGQDDEERTEEEKQYYRELNLGTGIRNYKYDDFEGTATNYGADYIGLFRIGETQLGVNVNALKLSSDESPTSSTQTLFGLRFKKSSYNEEIKKRSTTKTSFSLLDSEFSDFGAAFSLVKTGKRIKSSGGMANKGFAMTLAYQSYNQNQGQVLNNGYVFGFMNSVNFSDNFSGSINGLLLTNIKVHANTYDSGNESEVQFLAGGTFGGSLFFYLFKGAGLQTTLSYTPSSFIFTYGKTTSESVASGYTDYNTVFYDSYGFYGASSISFDVGFTYRF